MPFFLKDMLLGAVSVPELAYFESENTLFFLFFFSEHFPHKPMGFAA